MKHLKPFSFYTFYVMYKCNKKVDSCMLLTFY